MEPKFENTFTSTKKYKKEMYSQIYFKKPLMIVMLIFMWVIFFATLFMVITTGADHSPLVLVVVPLYTIFLVFFYFYQVYVSEKRETEMYGGPLEIVSRVTDECIESSTSTGVVNRLEYGNVARVLETKNLILLCTKARLLYAFDKNTFTGGTKEEFMEFLKSKGIKV